MDCIVNLECRCHAPRLAPGQDERDEAIMHMGSAAAAELHLVSGLPVADFCSIPVSDFKIANCNVIPRDNGPLQCVLLDDCCFALTADMAASLGSWPRGRHPGREL